MEYDFEEYKLVWAFWSNDWYCILHWLVVDNGHKSIFTENEHESSRSYGSIFENIIIT